MFLEFTSRNKDFCILYVGKNARVCPQNVLCVMMSVGIPGTAEVPKEKVRQTLCKSKYDE